MSGSQQKLSTARRVYNDPYITLACHQPDQLPRLMAPPTTSDKASNLEIDWDGTPLTRSPWLVQLPDREAVSKHRSMWELGVVTVPGKPYVYTSSRSHSYQLTINNIVRGTFKAPFDAANMSLKDPSKTYAAAVAAERAAATSESRDQEEVYDTRAYIPNKYLYDQEGFKIFESVTKTIFNMAVVKDLKADTNESGLGLLKLLAKQDAAAKQDSHSYEYFVTVTTRYPLQ